MLNFNLEKLRSSELKTTATESGGVKTGIMLWEAVQNNAKKPMSHTADLGVSWLFVYRSRCNWVLQLSLWLVLIACLTRLTVGGPGSLNLTNPLLLHHWTWRYNLDSCHAQDIGHQYDSIWISVTIWNHPPTAAPHPTVPEQNGSWQLFTNFNSNSV